MDQTEFDERMNSIDRQLAAADRDVVRRPLYAWAKLTGEKVLDFAPHDPNLGPYERPNRFWSVLQWYEERYPKQLLIGHAFGPRPIVIRNTVFRADIPALFDPTHPLNAFDYLPDVPPALFGSLDQFERDAVNARYQRLFRQGSVLEMARWQWHHRPDAQLASKLLENGRADLRMACDYSLRLHPGQVLFVAQQAAEKYLKALLAVSDPTWTDSRFKNEFSHKMTKLLDACTEVETRLKRYRDPIVTLERGPKARYETQPMTAAEAVRVIDLSHDMCYSVASHLLTRHPRVA